MINNSFKASALLVQVFVVSVCSLTYELLMATASTNITGNSILSFSLAIGLFLAGLGLGAFVSQWLKDERLPQNFVLVETSLALVGGFGVIALYSAFIFTPHFELTKTLLTLGIGFLSGLEIPILTRILSLEKDSKLKAILANVLSFDYLGGLAASVLFPLILLPYFGLVRLSFLVGILNCLMAILAIYLFWPKLKTSLQALVYAGLVFMALLASTFYSGQIYNFVESYLYRDPIIYSAQSQYQRLVLTKNGNDTRLYLNGGIQFSSMDEYRYHEGLVVPAMAHLLEANPQNQLNVVVLGGGDGLAVRELLKFEEHIRQIQVVDIDPMVTELATHTQILRELNESSLLHEKVRVHNEDAWLWVQSQPAQSVDLFINDFPDPDDASIAKLYSQEFFRFSRRALAEGGVLVTQSTSPYATPKAFWSIQQTMDSVFPGTRPYTLYVPSFGLWGFNLAVKNAEFLADKQLTNPATNRTLSQNRFINSENLGQIFVLPPDIQNPRLRNGEPLNLSDLKTNTLDNLILTNYYTKAGQEVF